MRRRQEVERGATAVEYAIVAGLMLLGLIPAVTALQETAGTYLVDTGEDIGTERNGPAVEYSPPSGGYPSWVEAAAKFGANLIGNGSFESPIIPGRAWRITAAAPWKSTIGDGIEIWGSGHSGVASADGNQHAELNAYDVTSYTQKLSVTSGSTYLWSVTHRARRSTSEQAEVLIDGRRAELLQSDFSWTTYDGVFVASSSSVTFELRSITGSGVGNLIDDVSLREVLS